LSVYLKLLGNLYFRNFLIAATVLNIGRKLSWVALGWFVYQVTGSSLAIGIVISSATISPLISSIIVGGILDQYDRRLVMVLENTMRGLLLSLIPILYWFDILSLWMIVSVVFINGFLSSFTTIGTASILPEFLNKEDLETGNAVFTMTGQVGSLIGPALGGFSTALIGAPMTLFLNVVCFMVAALLYFIIPSEAYHSGENKQKEEKIDIRLKLRRFLIDTKEGFSFIFSYKVLILIALVTFLFNFTYAPLEPMLPVFVDDILDSGPETLGTMWSFFAIGSFVGALIWVKIGRRFPYSYSLGLVIILWGIVPTSLGFVANSLFIYILMFLGGLVYSPYNIVSPTLRQKLVPNTIRGRVFGVYGLIAGLGFPLGVYLGGLVAELVGVVNTIIMSGVLTMLLGFFVAIHPILRFKDVKPLNEESHLKGDNLNKSIN
jgi:MFS family permease